MGKAVNSRFFGDVTGTLRLSRAWIPGMTDIEYATQAENSVYIIKQFGTRRFVVSDGTHKGIVTLQAAPINKIGQGRMAVLPYNAGSGGSGATAVAIMGAKTSEIGVGGTGYTSGDIVTSSGGTGTSTTYTIVSVDGSGVVTAISILTKGAYTISPSAGAKTTTGGTGTGLTINTTAYEVVSTNITAAGSGYINPPDITFSGGTAATGTSSTDGNTVTGIVITNGGTYGPGSSGVPTVTITGNPAEYARTIMNKIVYTYARNRYSWKPAQNSASKSGEANLPIA